MQEFLPGQRWISDTDLQMGLGTVVAVEQRTVTIVFNAVGETRRYAKQSAPLTRVVFSAGDNIPSQAGWVLQVESVVTDEGLIAYVGKNEQGQKRVLVETELANFIQMNRPIERLFNGQFDKDKFFRLRYQTLSEYDRQSNNELHGLVGTRTSLIPHQLYIANEVARRYAPRVLLADEVGLGKTIEAGLILHQQLLSERVKRVLIVVPESLIHQWLVEMLRRFNLYFSLFDEGRCIETEQSNDGDNPFQSEQLILCSLEFLRDYPNRTKQGLNGEWDLLIVDEAHHLHWSPDESSTEYQIVEQLSLVTKGVLLLTATPEQLGKASHFARLRLLDPDRFSDYQKFVKEEESYEALADSVSALLDKQCLSKDDIVKLSSVIEESDGQVLLGKVTGSEIGSEENNQSRQLLIDNLLDRHGTGRVLFRNTRSAVKGFPERKLIAYPLPLPELYSDCLAKHDLNEESRHQLLLSPELLYMEKKKTSNIHWTRMDPRIAWLVELLKTLKIRKVLLIAASIETVLDLVEALKVQSGIYAAVFHEQMTLLERDRAAAYFANQEEGCQLLICSEIGSEGRNFQFAHHLVLFDLPLNPDLLEQRIGRLDRIGQTELINIHVPYMENSAQSVMYHWYQQGLDAFEQTCPAGYPVYFQLQTELLDALNKANIEHHDMPDFIERSRGICARINQHLHDGRDRLLEYSSCRPAEAVALKTCALEQDTNSNIEQFMDTVFDCFGVHAEEHSKSIYIIRPGEHMLMPFPGLLDDGMTVTYSRETALTNEDMVLLSWEHPMVINSFDMVLTAEFGNSVVCSIEYEGVAAGTMLMECLFVLAPASVAGTQANRYLPPSMIRIVIDEKGRNSNLELSHELINLKHNAVPDEIARQVIKMKQEEIGDMISTCEQLAEQQSSSIVDAAHLKSSQMFDGEINRLKALSEVNNIVREEEIEYFENQKTALTKIFKTASLRLDAIRVIVAT